MRTTGCSGDAGASRLNAIDPLGGNGHSARAHIGLYGIAPLGPLQLSATVDYLHLKHHVSRPTGVGEALTDLSGNSGSAGLQLTWPLTMRQWRVTPRTGALYQHQTLDGFNEAVVSNRPLAAAYGVEGRKSTFNSSQAYGAVSLVCGFVGARMTYTPSFDLGYRDNTCGDTRPLASVRKTAQALYGLASRWGAVWLRPARELPPARVHRGACTCTTAGCSPTICTTTLRRWVHQAVLR